MTQFLVNGMVIDGLSLAVGLVTGLLLGAAVVWVVMRAAAGRAEAAAAALHAEFATRLDLAERTEDDLREEIEARDHQIARLHGEVADARERHAQLSTRLEAERTAAAEKMALLERAQAALADSFKALSAEALHQNNRSFLDLARETLAGFQEQAKGDLDKRQTAIAAIVDPVRQSLEAMDRQIRDLESTRAGAYEGLKQQVLSLVETQTQLRAETGNLVRALRTPAARGRWGEIQLRRVCEMAGMLDHCDFVEQVSVDSGRLRGFRVPGSRFRRIPRDALIQFMKDNGIPPDALDNGKTKVLVVDDDPEIVELFVDVLERDGRFEVKTAATGYDAGMLTQEFNPDLVILDYMLPDINGQAVCELIRQDPSIADIKIICISGMVEEDKIEELKASGADDFLHKPLDIDELIRRICRLLDMEVRPNA